ncbi:helix-turn-helix domain-containing protein [Hoeflea alexandrii]|uniref:helix-turn-helix domain-containing protein n=1 Tax=Hoeflea alexandrii TaxID=288436 RepID=UPI0035CF4F04
MNILQHGLDPGGFDQTISRMILELILRPGLPRTAIRLFVVLAYMMNRRTGSCYPGINSLAEELGVTPQAVRRACRELENAGFIHVEHNASILRTNLFFINAGIQASTKSGDESGIARRKPETTVSGSLSKGVFGEAAVSGLTADDQELLDHARKRSWRND